VREAYASMCDCVADQRRGAALAEAAFLSLPRAVGAGTACSPIRIGAGFVRVATGSTARVSAGTAGAGTAVYTDLVESVTAGVAAHRTRWAAGLCLRIANVIRAWAAKAVAYVVAGRAALVIGAVLTQIAAPPVACDLCSRAAGAICET